MRILFTLGDTYSPQRSGGVQSSTDESIGALVTQGHRAAVACALGSGGWTEWQCRVQRVVGRTKFARTDFNGYPVYRAWNPENLSEVVERFQPDIAVLQNGLTVPMANGLKALGIPCVIYFRNVEFDELDGDAGLLAGLGYISNSMFTASRVKERYGFDSAVIRPFVDPEKYVTSTTGENVTFINPYPEKGVDIAIAIAERCPDIPFAFVESWALDDQRRSTLQDRLKSLPNVTLHPRTSHMKRVYSKARILLAPSRWEEAWGRVATEAHLSGIPVVGSRQGGLPEAIGPGGVTVAIDAPIEHWVAAVRMLWDDKTTYAQLSSRALAFSRRPEMDIHNQTHQLIETLAQNLSQ